MTVIRPNSISGINSITAQTSALNFYDSAGATLSIGASVTGNITGNVTGNVTGDVTGNLTGDINAGIITATTITGVSTIGVTTVTATNLTVNGNAYPTAGPLSNRNLIINGAMNVAQRGTQITGASSVDNYYVCDRFTLVPSSLGTWTIDQSSDSPNGFNNSLKITCTTADPSPSAGDNVQILYKIEAQDLQCLSYGNSDAKAAILSFWVKSNKTGNATVEFFQSDNSNRMLSKEYTINSADTWEYKTISIPADTSGLFNDDNGLGMEIGFWLNTGSNFTSGSLKTVWGSYSAGSRNPSNLGVGGAISDYFAITGLQLEVGEVATPFEHRSYGDELARCQRYCQRFTKIHASGTVANSTETWHPYTFPVAFRASPTLTVNALGNVVKEGTNWYPNTAISLNDESQFNTVIKCTQSNNNMVATNSTRLGQGCDLTFSAEF